MIELTADPHPTPQLWWVVFHDHWPERLVPKFYDWFTRPGYRHCFCFTRTAGGVIVINPLAGTYTVDCYPALRPADIVAAVKAKGWTVGCLVAAHPMRYSPKGLITCVSIVKAFLGIRDWRIVTPWQLYNRLVPE